MFELCSSTNNEIKNLLKVYVVYEIFCTGCSQKHISKTACLSFLLNEHTMFNYHSELPQ